MEKVYTGEVVQCPNNNCFSGLNIDVALIGSPIVHQIVRDAPDIATYKNNKAPCNQMPKTANE